ncbi:hypothetical protein OESDEN_12612 [Oesophagostomum dentatum]|uniref:Uncharacterized protein n=1 Tax=Oesophagostomum dentatum TaxID=61180 RepID=A0A0B1SQN7_OESDE|nr:hypothetical protein OESDEN_12612 [Oesophagostomum dentatum]
MSSFSSVTSEVVDLPSESSKQQLPVKVVLEKDLLEKGKMDSEAKHVSVPREGASSKEITAELEATGANSNDKPKARGEVTQDIESLKQQSRNDDEDEANSFRGEIIAEGRTAVKVNESDKEDMFNVDDSTHIGGIDLPKHLKPAKERKRVDKQRWKFSENEEDLSQSPISDVLRELESAADFRIPMDDKHIRSVLRRNRKLMRALVEAYKLRTTTIASTSTTINTAPKEESTNSLMSSLQESENIEGKSAKVLITTELRATNFAEPKQKEKMTLEALPPAIESTPSTNGSASSSESSSSATEATSEAASTSESSTVEAEVANENSTTLESTTSSENFQQDMDMNRSTDNTLESTSNSTDNTLESTSSSDLSSSVEESMNATEAITITEETPVTAIEISGTGTPDITKTEQNMLESTDTVSASTTTTDSATVTEDKGYVPNTRKHASEITSKLYMTQEIVQVQNFSTFFSTPVKINSAVLLYYCKG